MQVLCVWIVLIKQQATKCSVTVILLWIRYGLEVESLKAPSPWLIQSEMLHLLTLLIVKEVYFFADLTLMWTVCRVLPLFTMEMVVHTVCATVKASMIEPRSVFLFAEFPQP